MVVSYQCSSPSKVCAVACLCHPQDFKTSIRFTMNGDGPNKVPPAAVVSTYHAFLLQVAARALDVRHRFLWEGVHCCSSCLFLPPAEFTLRTRTRSNPVQPLSTWKRARNHLLDSSLFGFRSFAGPDPRAQDFSAFSPPQQELSRPSRGCRFVRAGDFILKLATCTTRRLFGETRLWVFWVSWRFVG